jgi:hypothetical protein
MAAVNELVLPKPIVIPIPVTENARFASSSLARSIRRLVWYRCGGMPMEALVAALVEVREGQDRTSKDLAA